jgi:hypothetical protein
MCRFRALHSANIELLKVYRVPLAATTVHVLTGRSGTHMDGPQSTRYRLVTWIISAEACTSPASFFVHAYIDTSIPYTHAASVQAHMQARKDGAYRLRVQMQLKACLQFRQAISAWLHVWSLQLGCPLQACRKCAYACVHTCAYLSTRVNDYTTNHSVAACHMAHSCVTRINQIHADTCQTPLESRKPASAH